MADPRLPTLVVAVDPMTVNAVDEYRQALLDQFTGMCNVVVIEANNVAIIPPRLSGDEDFQQAHWEPVGVELMCCRCAKLTPLAEMADHWLCQECLDG